MGWDQELKTLFRNYEMKTSDIRMQKTDIQVKYCEECEQTWESYYCISKHCRQTMHHGTHIPSIGKDRKNCPDCESKKASELVKYQGV